MTNKHLKVTVIHRPFWGLGIIQRVEEFVITPPDTANDADVYEMAQKFIDAGAEVNVVEGI